MIKNFQVGILVIQANFFDLENGRGTLKIGRDPPLNGSRACWILFYRILRKKLGKVTKFQYPQIEILETTENQNRRGHNQPPPPFSLIRVNQKFTYSSCSINKV